MHIVDNDNDAHTNNIPLAVLRADLDPRAGSSSRSRPWRRSDSTWSRCTISVYVYIYIYREREKEMYILGWAWGLLVAINSYMLGYNLYKYSYNPYKLFSPLTKSPKSPEGYNHTYI